MQNRTAILSCKLVFSVILCFAQARNLRLLMFPSPLLWSLSLPLTSLPTRFYLFRLLFLDLILLLPPTALSPTAWWQFLGPEIQTPAPHAYEVKRLQHTWPDPFQIHSAPVPWDPHLQEVVPTPPSCAAERATAWSHRVETFPYLKKQTTSPPPGLNFA